MPRLLLVDDNPSIHRIAESLLAPTDVELVCVDSAAEALDRIERGERFDVALVDTAMPGMDGWTLLSRLRSLEATAKLPIALMAGVLDPVDPGKLAKAPVQGFLKKPIELRELGDRVKTLLATPVVVTPSPFSTVPATPARDLVQRAEKALPELRPEVDLEDMGVEAADLELPEPEAVVPVPVAAEREADLLVLTPEDLWAEPAVEPVSMALETVETPEIPASPEVRLDLEELDLDLLQDLDAVPAAEAAPVLPSAEEAFGDELVTLSGLEDLEGLKGELDFPTPIPAGESFPSLEDAASAMGFVQAAPAMDLEETPQAPVPPPGMPVPEPPVPLAEAVPAPAAGGQVPDHPGQPASHSPASDDQARAVVQALLADPVLVDALVKAVVARMGDQVLREIAWEVMPDLAGRLQR